VSVHEDGMAAITQVKRLKANDDFSFLEIRLLTGRTHQIRVHLAHAGHPILGDDKYGDFDLNHRLERTGVRRLFLHASRLAFSHPLSRESMKLEAPLPAEMKRFVEKTLS
jgi:23S rRNA pseudouridine955/2504/2580 synthase